MCTAMCKKQIACFNFLLSTGSSAQCSVLTQMDETGETEGSSKREWINAHI